MKHLTEIFATYCKMMGYVIEYPTKKEGNYTTARTGTYRLLADDVGSRYTIAINGENGTVSPQTDFLPAKQLHQYISGAIFAARSFKIKPNETIIDNNQRVFMVTWSIANSMFCNLQDLPKVIKDNNLRAGYYTIYHFWNNKQIKATKKLIKDMLSAHRISMDFHY